ncbi:MAG TPA: hypothetical protein VMW51_00410, partial [Terriglobia bacterium]|nr:hypothetical protein [Terriglobia bacterium]
ARQLQFPPLAWPRHQLATVRTAIFVYDPLSHNGAERVMAFGNFGNLSEPHDQPTQRNLALKTAAKAARLFLVEGHTRAGLEILRQEAENGNDVPQVYRRMVLLARDMRWRGELQAAAAVLRQAVPLQPKDDFAERELAKTLKASGDRAGAIEAYQRLLKMDPEDAESHYSLATEYEAEATEGGRQGTTSAVGKSQPSVGGPAQKNSPQQSNFQMALAQYSLAEKFSPENTVYSHAYQSLSQKINSTSHSVATHVPRASTNP